MIEKMPDQRIFLAVPGKFRPDFPDRCFRGQFSLFDQTVQRGCRNAFAGGVDRKKGVFVYFACPLEIHAACADIDDAFPVFVDAELEAVFGTVCNGFVYDPLCFLLKIHGSVSPS